MKKFLPFFILCYTLLSTGAFAKIWRVNNSPGVMADFTSLAAAHNGAGAGDTLHLEGSGISYGDLECTKKLVIIGPGYFLAQNPNTQASKENAIVNKITFRTGASGSEVMGLDFNGKGIDVFASDVTIRRNKFSTANGNKFDWVSGLVSLHFLNGNTNSPVKGIVIAQNYGLRIDINRASTDVAITHNYLVYGTAYGDATLLPSLVMHPNAVALVQNNIFRNGKIVANNSTFLNNIMVAGVLEGVGNLMANNLAGAGQFGHENGNQENLDMGLVFVGAAVGVSPDGQWQLQADSPAKGTGYGSTPEKPIDAGMFGGQTPYVLSGLPPVPAIYFIENEPVGSNVDPIQVIIKVKPGGN